MRAWLWQRALEEVNVEQGKNVAINFSVYYIMPHRIVDKNSIIEK